ncbi:MAG: VOC family protein [Planctomycetota bacterium]|nr:VOC family protein [Planctomycetota bacterium]
MSLDHKIIWNEVHCTDLDATIAFYEQLFGWTTKPEERETYVHFYMGEAAVAGLMVDDGEPQRPMWQVYVGTSDIEAYVERAKAAGQREVTPLMDIPHTGKLQILGDSEGGLLAPFQPSDPERKSWGNTGTIGHFCWVELLCKDQAAAVEHYTQVVGWETVDMDLGGMTYSLFVPPGGGQMDAIGGAMQMPPGESQPAAWLPYVAVEDVDATTKKAVELGATVCVEPTPIAEHGRFSVLTDPDGAMFATYKSMGDC